MKWGKHLFLIVDKSMKGKYDVILIIHQVSENHRWMYIEMVYMLLLISRQTWQTARYFKSTLMISTPKDFKEDVYISFTITKHFVQHVNEKGTK